MQERAKISPPDNAEELLLHVCCAPCSGGIVEALAESGVNLTVYFYNPNIHPRTEYEARKSEVVRFAHKKNIPFIDADYDPDVWFERIKGLEDEPERGARCDKCFDLRLENTALYAHENKFSLFATSLGISRWKNIEQVNASGMKAAARYETVRFWDFNWRKNGGTNFMTEVSKRENFYRQEYCGCVYSLRDANRDCEKCKAAEA